MCGNGQGCRSVSPFKWSLSAVLLLVAWLASAQQSPREKMDAFAKCLTKKNAVMYGSALCPHCDDQRKLFGDSFKFVHYVECSRAGKPDDVNACKSAQIRYTPTWVLSDGERLLGVRPLKDLSDKTGCPMP